MSTKPANAIAFVATVHDPSALLLPALRQRGEAIGWYGGAYVCATDVTDNRVVAALRQYGATVIGQPVGRAGAGRRTALAAAAEAGHADFFSCDLDRWLHWRGRLPDELAALPGRIARRRPRPWFACLGRSARAFASHPTVQRMAEGATNRALSVVVGRRIDATAGACWLSREAADIILAESTEPTAATDLEWPALVYRADPCRLTCLKVEGLEFETAEFSADAVAAAGGHTAWVRAVYDRPEVWSARLRLAADAVAAMTRVLAERRDDPQSATASPPADGSHRP